MKVIGVIPARLGSTRLKDKVLADIGGKPMVQHVWECAKKAKLFTNLYVATDHQDVVSVCKRFGAEAVMTSVDHPSGTDRVAEVARKFPADIVVNIQGDEPVLEAQAIDSMIKVLLDRKECVMSTVIKHLTNEADFQNPNTVKVVLDKDKFAIYFSRSPIPYNRDGKAWKDIKIYKHLGLYAYRKDFLLDTFVKMPPSSLEQMERLEQLRVLEAGYKIMTVETTTDNISVDTADDLNKVREFLAKR